MAQQDPPGTGDHTSNPRYVDAFVYIGDFMDSGAGAGDITAVTAGTGLSGGASSGAATLSIDNDIVATISGSTFTGDVVAQAGLSGSLSGCGNVLSRRMCVSGRMHSLVTFSCLTAG